MTTEAAKEVRAGGDWDMRGRDVDQRYARWTLEALTDDEMLALGKAAMVQPPGSVADQLFLTSRSECDCYGESLVRWGLMVADGIAKARYRHPGGQRYRAYCEGYDPLWGRQAVLDGLALAMFGPSKVTGLTERAAQFQVGAHTYQKIRDFVGGIAAEGIGDFRFSLLWAAGTVRDRELDARYEAITALNEIAKTAVSR